jgi:hypothetical protein
MDKVELTNFEREYSYLRYGGSATEFMLDNPEAVKQIKEEAKIVLEFAEKEVKQQTIAKACKYLQDHREEVETEDNGISGWISDEFIEKFKKAMRDE